MPDRRLVRVGGGDRTLTEIRIAVADDDTDLREALADVVRQQTSLRLVGTAKDGREAVELATRTRPDVVLMDVRMPLVDGAEATRQIRAGGLPTRVVALSAYEDRATLLAMLHAGAVGYLVKGCPVEEIVQAAQRAARGLSTLSAEVSGELVHEMAARLEQDERVARRRHEILRRIRGVLGGSLQIVLQPIVNLETGVAVGTEALSRFRTNPDIPPAAWFADASAVGLRVDLELCAMKAALAVRSDLPSDILLSVNVGPETVRSPRFAEAVPTSGLEGLVLEITEHAPVDDYEALAAVLAPLRSMGLRLAVDDAGAGFASLRHILRLDPDVIKLDKELTRGLDSHSSRRALATALISFAREIGADIVAEGIEAPGEVEALRQLGVRYGQGFHLGRPAPVDRCLVGLGHHSVNDAV